MTDIVYLSKINDAFIRIDCDDRGIIREISESLTFRVPGAQFMPKVRNGVWDGLIRLVNLRDQTIYAGLAHKIESFCKARDYELVYQYDNTTVNYSLREAKEFIENEDLTYTPRDYQYDTFVHAIRNGRAIYESPTSSGKSLIMYMIMRYYLEPTLIIVPTTTLIHQLYSDFAEYGFNSEEYIHKIYSGQDKNTEKPIIITTWQSVYKMPKEWFDQFNLVLGDECHHFKSKSLITIMTKLTDCPYRFGFSGTVVNEDASVHEWVLEGLFGEKKKVITTKELMDAKHVADLNIKILALSYPEEERRIVSKLDYQGEMDYIVSHEKRMNFVRNLVLSLKGNTLVLFQFVDKHGKILYNSMNDVIDEDRKLFFIHGGVKGEDRNDMRPIVEKEKDAIIIASYGTLSTGVSIRNIHNLVFASPSKSRIRNLQSIGRSLRISDEKTNATLFDIADDFSRSSKMNITLKHLMERIKIYDQEQFKYKLYRVKI